MSEKASVVAAISLLFPYFLFTLSARAAPGGDEATWRWYAQCPAPQAMRIHVTLRGGSIFDVSVPVCLVTPAQRTWGADQKVLRFFFEADAASFGEEFQGWGVRRIEGNVWEAGGEADALLLGVSFAVPERILLNSIHVAEAPGPSRMILARRLIISTALRTSTRKAVVDQAPPPNKALNLTKGAWPGAAPFAG